MLPQRGRAKQSALARQRSCRPRSRGSLAAQCRARRGALRSSKPHLYPRAYCQQRPITLNEINLLVRGNFAEDIFRLTDAIGNQNKKLALQLLNQQLINTDPKEHPRIFSMIIRQFRLLIQIKDVLAKQTVSQASLAKQLGLHPFVVSKTLPQTNKYTLEQLKNIYQKLLMVDIKIKTGQAPPELLLDILIAETG